MGAVRWAGGFPRSHLSVDSVPSVLWPLPITKSGLASVKLSTTTTSARQMRIQTMEHTN